MSKRIKFNRQGELEFKASRLRITKKYYKKYERISQIVNENPEIVETVHRDLAKVFGAQKGTKQGRKPKFTSETILRVLIVKHLENLDYRGAVIRIDDSEFLRRFVGVGLKLMMDYSTLCDMFKAIRPGTWKKVNDILTAYAQETGKISGDELRRDTTVVEANIHYPTDSGLLWDTYRVLGRFIDKVRQVDHALVGEKRLQTKKVKKLYMQINRQSSKRAKSRKRLKSLYKPLIGHVESILMWADQVCEGIHQERTDYTWEVDAYLLELGEEYKKYIPSGVQVVDQARRRVFDGQQVPNEEKIFSLFEPHVELIKRGKAGKPLEFGHVVNIQQVKEKFITGYEVFKTKPVEHSLVDPSLAKHQKSFGRLPGLYADDKGAYESMEKLCELEKKIPIVAIGKKGKRNRQEQARENDPLFKLGQKFRAGIEGSISFLKRIFGLAKCFYKGWKSFQASVGSVIFCHNLVILSRE